MRNLVTLIVITAWIAACVWAFQTEPVLGLAIVAIGSVISAVIWQRRPKQRGGERVRR